MSSVAAFKSRLDRLDQPFAVTGDLATCERPGLGVPGLRFGIDQWLVFTARRLNTGRCSEGSRRASDHGAGGLPTLPMVRGMIADIGLLSRLQGRQAARGPVRFPTGMLGLSMALR